jgi:single-strand DNA-binding protein
MNQANLIGRLTRDPEVKQTASGISVCTFSIAITRTFNRDETDYINIVTWRALAENCGKYLAKGRQVGVSGRIQSRSYEGNDGKRRYVTEIVADNVEFLGSGQRSNASSESTAAPKDAPPAAEEVFGAGGGTFTPVDDDNLPF